MGATSIEWAHYTVNVWEGCTKISPACKHCYAEHDGGHDWTYWAQHLPDTLRFFGQTLSERALKP